MDNHRLHNYDETEAVAKKRSLALSDVLKLADHSLVEGKAKPDYSYIRKKLAFHHEELKKSLQCHFEKFHKSLADREADLLSCLQSLIEKEYIKINDAENDYTELVAQFGIKINRARELVSDSVNVSVVTEGKRLLTDLKRDINSITEAHVAKAARDKCVEFVLKEEDDTAMKNFIEKMGIVSVNNTEIKLESVNVVDDQCHIDSEKSGSIIQPTAIISCTEKGQNFHPCGIAVGSNNLVTVSDLHNNSVKVLTSTGKVIDTIESSKGSNLFKGPCALHVNKNDIYILERDNKSIKKYTNGSLVDLGKFSKQLNDPRGIIIFRDKVYVTDWKVNCIHVLNFVNNRLIYQSSIGEGFLKQPAGIAYDFYEEKIVVTDQDNHCVWVLTSEGDIINSIGGEKGNLPGMLNAPYGVAVTKDGKVIISEKGNSRISVFSIQGEFLFCFGNKGSSPGHFNQLRHVCINCNHQILVADEMNQRVQIFDM